MDKFYFLILDSSVYLTTVMAVFLQTIQAYSLWIKKTSVASKNNPVKLFFQVIRNQTEVLLINYVLSPIILLVFLNTEECNQSITYQSVP